MDITLALYLYAGFCVFLTQFDEITDMPPPARLLFFILIVALWPLAPIAFLMSRR